MALTVEITKKEVVELMNLANKLFIIFPLLPLNDYGNLDEEAADEP